MISYFIRLSGTYENIPAAREALAQLQKKAPLTLRHAFVSYKVEPTKFKKWVPNWVIRLIVEK